MARFKVQTSIYMTPEQDERLRAASDATQIPMQAIIRDGLESILPKYEALAETLSGEAA